MFAIVAVALASGCVTSSAVSQMSAPVYQVVTVIDGDTFTLSNGEKVRLIGIDAPESQYSYKLTRDASDTGRDVEVIRALGDLSARYLESIALGRDVVLGFDPANAMTNHRDRFGRLLAYVSLTDATGEPLVCINDLMIDAGYANVYSKYPFGRLEWYREAETGARTAERGLWAPDALTTAESRSLLEIEEEYFVTKTGSRYHRASCRSLRSSKIPLDEASHPDRYDACKICKPGPKPVAAH